jgi:pimeloyl-ACP methyl ester carboxylesterase
MSTKRTGTCYPISVVVLAAALVAACSTPVPVIDADVTAYGVLRQGYAERSESTIASAYAPGARVSFDADDPPAEASGADAITALYRGVLNDLAGPGALDLNFRIEARRAKGGRLVESGAYRLKAGAAGTGFGRFEVVRDAVTGKFLSDRSLPGTREDFERMPGPVLFSADTEDLDPAFYGRLSGRYQLDDGCALVVTHSVVRLLVRNTCDASWRGLERLSGTRYAMGDTVRPVDPQASAAFRLPSDGVATHLTLTGKTGKQTAKRADPYTREDVTFSAPDGTVLAGTVWTPIGTPRAATVLVHGSGPQDRNGYASIIAVMADALAAEGHVVLAYDKRGAGQSSGDGDRAGFGVLASDAEAARQYLASIPALQSLPAGFAGSSQAGWVIAEAVQAGAAPAHVILVGAAGSALTVEEQNLYNTRVLMTCAGIAPKQIDLALRQQRAFFGVLAEEASGADLDRLTDEARRVPALSDWVFPASAEIDRTSGDWFNVLALRFDPHAVWSSYAGDLTLILSRFDDSTPTDEVIRRWEMLNRENDHPVRIIELANAQHIGLSVSDICQTDFGTIDGFDPNFFRALREAATITPALP